MVNQTLTLNVVEKHSEKNFYSKCGVVFLNTDDDGNITSVKVKHNMFPGVDMVAFPNKDKEGGQSVVEE